MVHHDTDPGMDQFQPEESPEAESPVGCASSHETESVISDEDGTLTLSLQPLTAVTAAGLSVSAFVRPTPCGIASLNGSWLLTLTPKFPSLLLPIRGPMRIEVASSKIRISGDIYVGRFLLQAGAVVASPEVPVTALVRRINWYPTYPQGEYAWYFRSLGVTYSAGKLTFKFERSLWNKATQEFVSKDPGCMEFSCFVPAFHIAGSPPPPLEMTGQAMIGGKEYAAKATKTSPYYRGCKVEVDVMTGRGWPASASSCDGSVSYTFTGVYRNSAGMDFRATIDEVNVPDDPVLTIAEMHALLASHRSLAAGPNDWRLWLLVGSKMDNTFGIMFDDTPPYREGSVGFYDAQMGASPILHPSASGKKLGEVPLAFLRTLIHEAGHAFNLYHPKHDVHGVPVGKTIMNQTGDVMGFATPDDPYPCNAIMAFNDHNRTSLIHSPDAQVKPGWKEFGWGHGSAWSGIAEPVDAMGLNHGRMDHEGLDLKLEINGQAHRGEYIGAKVTLKNTSTQPLDVTAALNLAEGDLRLSMRTPSGDLQDVSDIVHVCGARRKVTLQPGQEITGNLQLFYSSLGFTFDEPGRYELVAELAVGDEEGLVARSKPVSVVIRPATTDEEREIERLSMDAGVGRSLAFGDFGADTKARERLVALMDRFGASDSGAAAAMVLANSLLRDFRDVRAGRVARPADESEANRALDIAVKGRAASDALRLSTAIVSPRELNAPLLDAVHTRIKKARKGTYADEDLERARKILSDHLA